MVQIVENSLQYTMNLGKLNGPENVHDRNVKAGFYCNCVC
jgi:hypothetical protein